MKIASKLGALRNGKGADLVMIDVKQKIGVFLSRFCRCRTHPCSGLPVVSEQMPIRRQSHSRRRKEYVPLPPDADLIAAILEAVTEESNAMIASDPAMKQVVAMADKIAPSEANGDDYRRVRDWQRSHVQLHPPKIKAWGGFVYCGELRGHSRKLCLSPSYSAMKRGHLPEQSGVVLEKFEEANGGTLLLDEVSEMHLYCKLLLRAIQEREITRIGSNDAVKVDVRIIATSNRNLEDLLTRASSAKTFISA